MPRRVRWLLRGGAIVLVTVLCVVLLRKLDLGRVMKVLRHADFGLVAVAVVLNLSVNLDARTRRWWTLLRALPVPATKDGTPGPPLRYRELLVLMAASYATSSILPARAGEALRTVQLSRTHGYRLGALVAVLLVEKLVEALSLGVLGLIVILIFRPPRTVAAPMYLLGAAGLSGIALFLVPRYLGRRCASPQPQPEEGGGRWQRMGRRIRGFFGRLLRAMEQMNEPRIWLRSVLFSGLSDLTDVAMVGLCLLAVGIHLHVAAWFMIFVVINLAIALPTTPGQVGVLEAGAVLVLRVLGVGDHEALAFALLYHAVHIVPLTVMGLLLLHFAVAGKVDRDQNAR